LKTGKKKRFLKRKRERKRKGRGKKEIRGIIVISHMSWVIKGKLVISGAKS